MSSSLVTFYEELSVQTLRGVSLVDITKDVAALLAKSECKEGVVTVLSRHSTVSVTINEFEGRFVDDIRQFLLKLVPPNYPYLHNDLDFRCVDSEIQKNESSLLPVHFRL
jgi:secondary thiamine-phosphate synthase enzyme